MKKTSGRTGRSSTSADDAFTPDARALDAERALRDLVSGFGSALVAFSGGVDSAYLAWIAHDVLGDRALAVTALSESYPAHHYDLALTLARQRAEDGVELVLAVVAAVDGVGAVLGPIDLVRLHDLVREAGLSGQRQREVVVVRGITLAEGRHRE